MFYAWIFFKLFQNIRLVLIHQFNLGILGPFQKSIIFALTVDLNQFTKNLSKLCIFLLNLAFGWKINQNPHHLVWLNLLCTVIQIIKFDKTGSILDIHSTVSSTSQKNPTFVEKVFMFILNLMNYLYSIKVLLQKISSQINSINIITDIGPFNSNFINFSDQTFHKTRFNQIIYSISE